MNETNEMRSERLVIQNINNKRTLERESNGNKKKRLKIAKDAQLQVSSNIINVKDRIYNIWRSNVSGIDWNKAAFHYKIFCLLYSVSFLRLLIATSLIVVNLTFLSCALSFLTRVLPLSIIIIHIYIYIWCYNLPII